MQGVPSDYTERNSYVKVLHCALPYAQNRVKSYTTHGKGSTVVEHNRKLPTVY